MFLVGKMVKSKKNLGPKKNLGQKQYSLENGFDPNILTCLDLSYLDLTCPDLTYSDLIHPNLTSPDLPFRYI